MVVVISHLTRHFVELILQEILSLFDMPPVPSTEIIWEVKVKWLIPLTAWWENLTRQVAKKQRHTGCLRHTPLLTLNIIVSVRSDVKQAEHRARNTGTMDDINNARGKQKPARRHIDRLALKRWGILSAKLDSYTLVSARVSECTRL